jgi:hypothetical protein
LAGTVLDGGCGGHMCCIARCRVGRSRGMSYKSRGSLWYHHHTPSTFSCFPPPQRASFHGLLDLLSHLPSTVAREEQNFIIVALLGPFASALTPFVVARTTRFVSNLFVDKTASVEAASGGIESAWWPRGVL